MIAPLVLPLDAIVGMMFIALCIFNQASRRYIRECRWNRIYRQQLSAGLGHKEAIKTATRETYI